MRQRPLDVPLVLRLERELHRVLRVADLGVRPEQQLRERRQGRGRVWGDRPLALARVGYAQEVGRDGEAVAQGLELLLQDLRDAGQDVDVLALDGRKAEPAVDDQLRALRHLRHLEPRFVHLVPEVLAELVGDGGVSDDFSVEPARDALHGDIVVRGADAARGEDEVVVAVELGDRGRDLVELVRDGEDAADGDAERAQLAGEKRGVGVDDLPREDLVADDDDARGPVYGPLLLRDRVFAEVARADADVDERRLAGAECALERGADVLRPLDPLAVPAERLDHPIVAAGRELARGRAVGAVHLHLAAQALRPRRVVADHAPYAGLLPDAGLQRQPLD